MKPLIHFAHANGVPSLVYQKLFDLLKDEYEVIYVPLLGTDKRYLIDNHWKSLTNQVIDSIVRQAKGRPVIGLGHSLGSVLTFQAALKRPELFSQVIMLDPPLIMGKDGFALHVAKLLKLKAVDRMSPAALSLRRRDHWDSREQAAELLRPKGFYKDFDADCFQAYIDYALTEDKVRGGVELTIPKMDEVKVFRTNPSLWWLPQKKIHLVILGIGEEQDKLEKKILDLKIETKVHLFGFKENVWDYISNAKFSVLSSQYEGFPMTILESLSLGIPVISFDCESGPNEMIINNHNGILVENQNFTELTHKMNIFVEDEILYQNCKNNSVSSVSKFQSEVVVNQWLQMLNYGN